MEKRHKFEMWALEVEVEHTELDDLDLDKQEWMQQAKVEAAEISEAKNKKIDKKRQEAEETLLSLMERLSESHKRRSNSDDNFDVNLRK